MKLYVAPYRGQSQSAANLARQLGTIRIKREGSTFQGSRKKAVINWGRQDNVLYRYLEQGSRIINSPQAVIRASNKLNAFQAMERLDVRIPDYTERRGTAREWLLDHDNSRVVARRLLRAHSARGMQVFRNGDNIENDPGWTNARLFVKYIPKRHEYRVHVGRAPNGDLVIIDTQRKGLREDINRDNANFEIRNLENGFIFVRNDGHRPAEDVYNQSRAAVDALGLDFGAVDVVFNERQNQAYVLEVNTAPGLTGTTVENYANFFQRFV